ncbi:MAG: efflux RND transporter permease subunit [bacterium]|nr:efflux RND transporter permease subunit [bacterium]
MNLPQFAIRRPVTVLVVTAAILVLGIVSMSRLKLDFLPKVDMPFVSIWMPYPNAVPGQVEREIVRPVEEIMATLGEMRNMSSWAGRDGGWVNLEFDFSRDIDILRLEVKEKMEQVRPILPDDLRQYFIFTFNTNDIPVMEGRISAHGRDLASSYDLLERRIINPLSRVEGVGRVEVDGIAPKDVTIYLLLDKIIEHGIDVGGLFTRLNSSNIDLSLGMVNNGRQRINVRSLGQFRSLDDVENLIVSEAGLRLKDIAEIIYSEPLPTYFRQLNGESAIAFTIQKASGANIVDVSRNVKRVLDEISQDPSLNGIEVVLFFDQADEITNCLKGLLTSGLIGSFFAVSVLLFFLRRFRPTLIAATAIPISVISTSVFLYMSGRSLNMLTMMGLMLAVGMLVDNAIVVLESIFKRQERGEESGTAARRGAKDVAMAVTASTLTSIIVFAPIILTKTDEMAIWLGEVGVTISITLIFSLLICLTLVPMLAARIPRQDSIQEFRVLSRWRKKYLGVLNWTALKHPKLTAWGLLPLLILITVLATKVTGFGASEFEEDDGSVKINRIYSWVEFTDNTNIYRVRDYVKPMEEFLLAKQDSLGVENVYLFYQDNFIAFSLYFTPDTDLSPEQIRGMRKYLREELPELAGCEYRFGDDNDAGIGGESVSVTLFGEDTDLLEDISEEVVRRIDLIDGMEDVGTNIDEGRDEIRVILDRQLASSYGVSPRSLSDVLGLTFRGIPLRRFQGAEREIDLGIVLEPASRRNIDNLKQLPITYREDRPVLLGQVARFEIAKGPQGIRRQHQKTALSINGTYEGEEFDDTIEEVEQIMNSLDLPAGYSWSFGRRLLQAQEKQADLAMNALLALVCVYLVMAALFESFLHPLVIMLCIPFAVIGVIWVLMLTNTPMNLFAMIGMVILVGVVVNNGIVLLDHINHLRSRGMSREQAIVEGCHDRFRPILMTASTTILGLMPLALGKTHISGGYYFPLARAVIGGLATSTVLTLVVLPTFYILAENSAAYVRTILGWGKGKGRLPWRSVEPVKELEPGSQS